MILAAIDGRSGAGKTTLASELEQSGDVLVFHMDDYYLPRSLHKPGIAGNMDLLRFRQEVLEPLRAGKPVKTRRFDCTSQQLCKEHTACTRFCGISMTAVSLRTLIPIRRSSGCCSEWVRKKSGNSNGSGFPGKRRT